MSDLDALYAQIVTRPDDDTVRLAYADLYEEAGASAAATAYANFVRAQIAVTRDPQAPDACHDVVNAWLTGPGPARRRAADPVLSRERPYRDGRSGPPRYEVEHWYARGFVDTITAGQNDFLRHAPYLFCNHPITAVRLRNKRPAGISRRSPMTTTRFLWLRYWEGGQSSLPHLLAPILFDRLPPPPDEAPFRAAHTASYPTHDAARTALNAACLAYGRRYRDGRKALEAL